MHLISYHMRCLSLFLLLIYLTFLPLAQEITLPLRSGSLRFAVIGDSGTGGSAQYQVAERMAEHRKKFPFEFVLMLGDNLYGGETPRDYVNKFERPYKALLDAGVKFYATLGNHDNSAQRFYKLFNMNGERYHSFTPKQGKVRFFTLDSTEMDSKQLEWLEKELRDSQEDWKICFFHHPLYSSGKRHGSEKDLQKVLEPLFVKYGVSVVFSGHDHFYERIAPQKGIYYFVSGGAAKLRQRNIQKTPLTTKGYDQDYHFMLVEIAGDELYFQAISRAGNTIDSGIINRQKAADSEKGRLSSFLGILPYQVGSALSGSAG